MTNCLTKKNYYIFNIAFIMRMVGIGIFNTLFNIYVSESTFSSNFLGLFLSVGNLSMALFSIPAGILIDKYSKKNLIILFTLIGAVCFLLQSTIINEIVLLFVSSIYGFAFIGLCTIIPPYLKEYNILYQGKNLIATNRALNIVATTIGALICGVLSGKLLGLQTKVILIAASVLYFASIIPLVFINNAADEESINMDKQHKISGDKIHTDHKKTFIFLIICLFFFLGIAPLITNYINLYFKNRFFLDISKVAYVYALINLAIGVFVLFFSKIKIEINKKINYVLFLLMCSIVLINIILIIVNNLMVQIIGVFLLLALFECLISFMYDLILSISSSKNHGRVSGIIQMSSNLSETIGIYICGMLLSLNNFMYIHIISIFTTSLSCIAFVMFFSYTNRLKQSNRSNYIEIN